MFVNPTLSITLAAPQGYPTRRRLLHELRAAVFEAVHQALWDVVTLVRDLVLQGIRALCPESPGLQMERVQQEAHFVEFRLSYARSSFVVRHGGISKTLESWWSSTRARFL